MIYFHFRIAGCVLHTAAHLPLVSDRSDTVCVSFWIPTPFFD